MSDYQGNLPNNSLADYAKQQGRIGQTGGLDSGYTQQQETVTSMLREILMRLGRIEQKL